MMDLSNAEIWTSPGYAHFGATWSSALGIPQTVARRTTADTVIAIGWRKTAYCDERTRTAKQRVIVWCGNDARSLRKSDLSTLRPNDVHLAANAELLPLLAVNGIIARTCWFPTSIHPRPVPLPEVPHVIAFLGNYPDRYGGPVFHDLRRRIGAEARFTSWGYGDHTDESLTALIEDSTCIVQAGSLHGGIVVREAAEAGRMAVSVYNLPHIARVDPDHVVACERFVREAIARKEPDYGAARFWAAENSTAALVSRLDDLLS